MSDTDFNAAFVAALNELTDVVKDKKADAGSYNYAYADLAAATGAARVTLSKHGLAVAQDANTAEDGMVAVTTRIYHTAGHVETFGPLTMPRGRGPQDTGSAITYARRYSLMAALGLATEDDDGKAAQQAAEEAAKPHPLNDRVSAAMADMKRLTDTAKADLKSWADGRKLSGSALLNDESWLALVETWLDERAATEGAGTDA